MKKAVLITGVSGGIGQAIARKFAQNGWDVVGTFNKNEISNDVADFCQERGVELVQMQLDITSSKEVEKTFSEAFKGQNIECVVCNSGISLGEKMLCDMTDEEIAKLIQTNLVGTIFCNREASKHFLSKKRGSIINISSIYAVDGGSCEAVYSATKAGINALSLSLAKELECAGVKINAVAPGFVETKMTACFSEEEKEAIRKSGEMNILKPEDVADAVYEITDKDISGQVLVI